MAYTGQTYETNAEVRAALQEDFSLRKVDVPDDDVERAARAEWIHSSFSDPGPDWNKFVLYDADGKSVRVINLEGY